MIEIRLLGPVEARVDGEPAPAKLQWKKNLALLVYLARSPKRTRTRDHLTGLLWGNKPERDARHSLREAIRVIRKEAGENAITTEQDQVSLADDVVALDTDRFEELEAAGNIADAVALIGGDLLEGFGVPDATPFEDWLAAERTRWRHRSIDLLTRHADDLLARGLARQARDVATGALMIDAGSGPAVRVTMRALAVTGDRASALERYDSFVDRLREIGAAPDAKTEELAERVRREKEWRLAETVPLDHEQGAESRRTPLVGRERELEQLTRAWTKCLEHRKSSAAIIEGESGVGKTRLADELLTRARLDGATTAQVRAVEADRETPFGALIGLARGGLLEASGLASASPAALASFAAEIPEWADRFSGSPGVREPLGNAFREIVRAVVEETPVLLLIDNARQLDRDSILVLIATLRDLREAALLVTFAVGAHPAQPDLDELRSRVGRDVDGVAVHLRPLDENALRELAGWALPAFSPEGRDRITRRLAADSAGLPLLAVELLHAIALGLDLGTITGSWPEPDKTLDQTLPGELPDAVVAAIRVGYRRLTADAQRVLATAAALGERVDVSRLERASGVSGEAVLTALDELEWQRWMTAEPRGYSFVARIVRDVVNRDMLTSGQRQRIVDAGG